MGLDKALLVITNTHENLNYRRIADGRHLLDWLKYNHQEMYEQVLKEAKNV